MVYAMASTLLSGSLVFKPYIWNRLRSRGWAYFRSASMITATLHPSIKRTINNYKKADGN